MRTSGARNLRQPHHVVRVLADVLSVHGFALSLARIEVQPRTGLEPDQPILADPGQTVGLLATRHDERVVVIVEQKRGQTGHALVERDRCEVTAFCKRDAIRCSTEQLQHDGKALIRRLLKAIEHGLAGVARLSDFVAPLLHEFPEDFAERGIRSTSVLSQETARDCTTFSGTSFLTAAGGLLTPSDLDHGRIGQTVGHLDQTLPEEV